ncbi:hypothetical protein OQA88_7683 [Cercophora sp. LCS_1]
MDSTDGQPGQSQVAPRALLLKPILRKLKLHSEAPRLKLTTPDGEESWIDDRDKPGMPEYSPSSPASSSSPSSPRTPTSPEFMTWKGSFGVYHLLSEQGDCSQSGTDRKAIRDGDVGVDENVETTATTDVASGGA